MRRLVYTVTTGLFHKEQALFTHPLIKAYAQRHGADFLVVDESKLKFPQYHRSFEDLQVLDWMNHYDEIVHLDTDTIVTSKTPWLLDISGGMMCACDEQGLYYNHVLNYNYYEDYCVGAKLPTTHMGMPLFNFRYFNLGVFGVTPADRHFFDRFFRLDDSLRIVDDKMGHQTPMNYHAVIWDHPIRDLGPEFNALSWSTQRSSVLKTAHILHYAGTTRAYQRMQLQLDLMTLKSMGRI